MKKVIEFNNITKKFGSLIANDSVHFDVYENEVHALLGENGAGKSTLMSILFGLYKPTSGSIKINGEEVRIDSPRHANELKIAMLPQHFQLIENMTVLQNVMLGYEITKKGFIDKKNAIEKIEKAQRKYKIKIDLKATVGKLSVSDKQKVELLKILWNDSDILIFDEPTSILTPKEIEQFLKLVKDLKKAGKTILIITHKLPEIRMIADRVSIIRKGKYIDTVSGKTSEKKLAELMVGKEVDLNLASIKKDKVNKDVEVLKVENLSYKAQGFKKSLHDISFDIKSGEIIGIAAIDGNGQSELMEIIGGLRKNTKGNILISEHNTTHKSSKNLYYTKEDFTDVDTILRVKKMKEMFGNASSTKVSKELSKKSFDEQLKVSSNEALKINNKHIKKVRADYTEGDYFWKRKTSLLSHIPEDRQTNGIVMNYSVTKNAVLQDLEYFSNGFGILSNKHMKFRLDLISKKYDVRGIQNHKTKVRMLSGGNQQKLILGREIERASNVLLAVHPTRGLDVGAIRNVYKNIVDARNKGTAVLLSSGELDEIMQVSDRIMVMYEGRIVSITKRGELNKLQLGSLMSTGVLKGATRKGGK